MTRVLCPLKECESLLGRNDKVVLGEEAMEEELKNAKIIVADPLYRPICPKDSTFMKSRMWHFREECLLIICTENKILGRG